MLRGMPEPGLSREETTRYSRHLLLPEVGRAGQARLAAARVLVVGAGGLGSPVLLYLAAAGVGTIGVVDDDVVDVSNLQRQVVHGTDDAGRDKVDSAADAVCRVNPLVRVVRHRERVTAQTVDALVAAYDVVVDGTDTFETRYVVGDGCARAGRPHVWASVLRFDAQIAVWWAGRGPCYRCVFPRPPAAGEVPSCSEAGVLGALTGVVGSVQATEALKIVLGVGEPLVGRLLVHDALRQTWDTLPVVADPDCAACGSGARGVAGQASPVDGVAELAPVRTIRATDLARAMSAGRGVRVVDVRPAAERAIVEIAGSEAVELADFVGGEAFSGDVLGRPDEPLVLVCKSGGRSAQAARLAEAAGWRDVVSLDGGVLAWVREVDPSLPTY